MPSKQLKDLIKLKDKKHRISVMASIEREELRLMYKELSGFKSKIEFVEQNILSMENSIEKLHQKEKKLDDMITETE